MFGANPRSFTRYVRYPSITPSRPLVAGTLGTGSGATRSWRRQLINGAVAGGEIQTLRPCARRCARNRLIASSVRSAGCSPLPAIHWLT